MNYPELWTETILAAFADHKLKQCSHRFFESVTSELHRLQSAILDKLETTSSLQKQLFEQETSNKLNALSQRTSCNDLLSSLPDLISSTVKVLNSINKNVEESADLLSNRDLDMTSLSASLQSIEQSINSLDTHWNRTSSQLEPFSSSIDSLQKVLQQLRVSISELEVFVKTVFDNLERDLSMSLLLSHLPE
ncbi:hypothetical protein RCL1_001878 [Eukaryota sp. TZLM3-RCL]